MVTYYAYTRRQGASWLGRGWVFGALGLGLAVGYHLQVPDPITIWVFPLLILGACYNEGRVSTFLQTRPLQRLGDWSYSIYMVHIPILFSFLAVQLINAPAQPAPAKPIEYGLVGPVVCVVYVILVLLVSSVTYRFVEVPARNYLNAKLKARQPAPLTPAVS